MGLYVYKNIIERFDRHTAFSVMNSWGIHNPCCTTCGLPPARWSLTRPTYHATHLFRPPKTWSSLLIKVVEEHTFEIRSSPGFILHYFYDICIIFLFWDPSLHCCLLRCFRGLLDVMWRWSVWRASIWQTWWSGAPSWVTWSRWKCRLCGAGDLNHAQFDVHGNTKSWILLNLFLQIRASDRILEASRFHIPILAEAESDSVDAGYEKANGEPEVGKGSVTVYDGYGFTYFWWVPMRSCNPSCRPSNLPQNLWSKMLLKVHQLLGNDKFSKNENPIWLHTNHILAIALQIVAVDCYSRGSEHALPQSGNFRRHLHPVALSQVDRRHGRGWGKASRMAKAEAKSSGCFFGFWRLFQPCFGFLCSCAHAESPGCTTVARFQYWLPWNPGSLTLTPDHEVPKWRKRPSWSWNHQIIYPNLLIPFHRALSFFCETFWVFPAAFALAAMIESFKRPNPKVLQSHDGSCFSIWPEVEHVTVPPERWLPGRAHHPHSYFFRQGARFL